MEYFLLFMVLIFCVAVCIALVLLREKSRYDDRGFDNQQIHKNGTLYDDDGYDYFGYDKLGYNREGYNAVGKNKAGKYNRYYNVKCFSTNEYSSEGFLNPQKFPVALTDHARLRMKERMGIIEQDQMDDFAFEAYQYGKSADQLMKTSAAIIREKESRYEHSVILLYRNFFFVFTEENVLITVYKNETVRI